MSVMQSPSGLIQRRKQIEVHKENILSGQPSPKIPLSPLIVASWQRCIDEHRIRNGQDCAPRDNEYEAWQRWDSSPLRLAATSVLEQAKQLANHNELVITLADPYGRLLWTCASKPVQLPLERYNSVMGGHWNEQAVGTNGVSLALIVRRPITVFAGEHYLAFLRDWVCYSAPIIHPQSGELQGVLSLGMAWKRHSLIGEIVASSLAQSIAQHLPRYLPRAELEIHALGQPRVLFRGKVLHVTPRMLEILCILALNPDGLTLEACHAALYQDEHIATKTLKAELSHLRTLLDGQITSRIYRLLGTVWVDFLALWEALRLNQTDAAHKLYAGELLPHSQAPEITIWRTCITAVMKRSGKIGSD